MADLRPRRSTKQINYKELLSLKVPAVTKRRRLNNSGGEKRGEKGSSGKNGRKGAAPMI